jgi:hypothetical protein
MAYFTKTEARSAAARGNYTQRSAGKTYDKILDEAVTAARDYDSFDVFLSHSVNDAELIMGVKTLLEEQGFKVYVDWIEDRHLDRRAVSKETAELLRRRLRQSKSLIYVATENATSSKWMPWELGFFDGFKPGNVAVMPLLVNASDPFPQQEYLALYPVVQKDTYRNGAPDIFVEEKRVRWSTLREFGRGAPAWRQYG